MQHALAVDETDSIQKLAQHLFDLIGLQDLVRLFDHIKQIATLNKIKRHIGGVVFFKYLMHTNDVGVVQAGKAAGLLYKQPHN